MPTKKLTKVDSINHCFRNIPLLGEAVFTAAENIMAVKPQVDLLMTVRDNLVSKYTDGQKTIDQTHPKWAEFSEEFGEHLNKEVEIPELKPITKDQIDKSRLNSQQNLLAELMEHGLIINSMAPAPK